MIQLGLNIFIEKFLDENFVLRCLVVKELKQTLPLELTRPFSFYSHPHPTSNEESSLGGKNSLEAGCFPL